ncbi:HEAT repeat domain-containing protein [Corallococcus sp. 4LFB]|uniref:HEAT repeat domain-containing protein n=1 Tax=Corallococcus sp. 4LFB TaxID=3383249 RepID=UPI0039770C4E
MGGGAGGAGRGRRSHPYDAHEALRAIGLGAVPALLEALATPRLAETETADANIRLNVLEALMAVGPLPRCAVPAVLGLLSRRSARVQRQALRALVFLRPRPTRLAVRLLLEACRDKTQWQLRATALDALAALDGPVPDDVLKEALGRLSDESPYVRRSALRLLGRCTPPSEEVLRALEEQVVLDDESRVVVLQVLSWLSPSRALPLLDKTAGGLVGLLPNDREGARLGLYALHLLAGMGEGARPAVGLLRRVLTHAAKRGHGDPFSWSMRIHAGTVADSIIRSGPLPVEARTPGPGSPRLARALAGPGPGPVDAEHPDSARLQDWVDSLGPLSQEAEVRLCVAVARVAARVWDRHGPENDGAQSALLALEEWVLAPDEAHQRKAMEIGLFVPSQLLASELFNAAWCLHYATLMVADADRRGVGFTGLTPRDPEHLLATCAWAAYRALSSGTCMTLDEGWRSSTLTRTRTPDETLALLHRAMVDEVLPWARGEWDPIRDVLRERRGLLGE